jgi:hypothetical protein
MRWSESGTKSTVRGTMPTWIRSLPERSRPIAGQLRAEGQVIDDDVLGLTTPLFRKHLNPFGKYHFDLERMRQTEGDPEQGIA